MLLSLMCKTDLLLVQTQKGSKQLLDSVVTSQILIKMSMSQKQQNMILNFCNLPPCG